MGKCWYLQIQESRDDHLKIVREGTMQISELLIAHRATIRQNLYTSDRQWESLLEKIRRREALRQTIAAERIWGFLVACGYAMGGLQGISKLTELLTGFDLSIPPNPKIWFEVQAIGPRHPKREGKTHIDLALGMIRQMGSTASGIELAPSKPSWICFTEMKWYTDISPSVTYDPNRNQLARDIENAVCFQTSGKYPAQVFFTVVTPRRFETVLPNSLLFKKYVLYQQDRDALKNDLLNCELPRNVRSNWVYPNNLSERLHEESLVLRWVCFEELIAKIPETSLGQELRKTWTNEVAEE